MAGDVLLPVSKCHRERTATDSNKKRSDRTPLIIDL